MIAEAWSRQVGRVWAQIVADRDLPRDARLVEVGPGFADKIGQGLAAIGFRGTLFVVEPNAAARRWVTTRYRELLEDAEIVPVDQPVSRAAERIGSPVHGLLMNHVLDDLLLFAALPPADRRRAFGEIRPESGRVAPRVRAVWNELLADAAGMAVLRRRVLDDLNRFIDAIRPGFFAACQYESWTLTNGGLSAVDALGMDLLRSLAARRGTTAEPDRARLLRHAQDPERWLVVDGLRRGGAETRGNGRRRKAAAGGHAEALR